MIHVVVCAALEPRKVIERELVLAEGSTVEQALQASGLLAKHPALHRTALLVGVWGRTAGPQHLLRDHDRVELYRPLTVDPKLARRARFVKQGSRSAGLFARLRPGAKAGY